MARRMHYKASMGGAKRRKPEPSIAVQNFELQTMKSQLASRKNAGINSLLLQLESARRMGNERRIADIERRLKKMRIDISELPSEERAKKFRENWGLDSNYIDPKYADKRAQQNKRKREKSARKIAALSYAERRKL